MYMNKYGPHAIDTHSPPEFEGRDVIHLKWSQLNKGAHEVDSYNLRK